MKIAVLGANGQLGSDICVAFEANRDSVARLTHADLEIASEESVKSVLSAIAPDLVINPAAMHHVEKCEADPVGAYATNGIGARNVAKCAAEIGASVAFISTDYVFGGEKQSPYLESDVPSPLNVYGITKVAGEHFARCQNPRHFILRVSGLYGVNPCRAKGGLNFVELMLKLSKEREELRVVDDEFVSPTPTSQVAQQLVRLSRTEAYGLYHATAEGSCSWYEFAQEIFAMSEAKVRVVKALPGEFPAKVPRPKYSVLENKALHDASLNVFTDWRVGLRNYLGARVTPAV
ncbi:MAG: dTDP-4-dehydrorhamnose reductase [Terracidiphilus sp.]